MLHAAEKYSSYSSLTSCTAQRQAAIVSPIPGTTRDVIEVPVDIKGYPVVFCDTAGFRDTADRIELQGVERALQVYVIV